MPRIGRRASALIILFICAVALCLTGFTYEEPENVKLVVIMYHNIIPDSEKPNKYEITLGELERDFSYITGAGYTSVTPVMLAEYTQKKRDLPKKAVMITFDDGFYNYNKYLPELLEKYGLNCVVSVVGEFSKFSKDTDAVDRYKYMDYDDMGALSRSANVEIANHTYAMHGYKGGHRGAAIMKGESMEAYRARFNKDCDEQEGRLLEVGIRPICFTYPLGIFCPESEQLIKERGYKMSLLCEERGNRITRNPNCLFKLGRYNRDGVNGSAEKIISKGLR